MEILAKQREFYDQMGTFQKEFEDYMEGVSKWYANNVDNARPLEYFQEYFKKNGGKVNDATDAYSDYFRSKGRATAKMESYQKNYIFILK